MITEVGPKRPQLVPCYEEVIAPIDPSHTHHRALDTATMLSRMAKVPLILVAVDTRHRDARSALNDLASTISDVVVDIEVLAPALPLHVEGQIPVGGGVEDFVFRDKPHPQPAPTPRVFLV